VKITANGRNGHHWVRDTTRLAIYLRDGLACVWCSAGVEQGAALTLDHITPRSAGGTNTPTNLITACLRCNSARQDMPIEAFAAVLYEHKAGQILIEIEGARWRELPRARARELIKARGTVARALAGGL